MLLVNLPILNILHSQTLIPDHQQILGILLLGCLGEIERTGDDGLSIYDHNLVVGNAIDRINLCGNPELSRKSAEEYFSLLWLLSKRTSTFTPLLCAFKRALAMGADVKE
jgi:hypothetical protein